MEDSKEFDYEKDIIIDESLLEERPAWEDEQDKELLVDLNKSNRLKKLKSTDAEGPISGAEFSKRLKKQYEKIKHRHSLLKWAEAAGDTPTEVGALDELLKHNKDIFLKDTKGLAGGVLEIERLKDANIEEKSEYLHSSFNQQNSCVIAALEFHPTQDLLLTAGLDKRVKLYNVSNESKKVASVYLHDLPITTAHFIAKGSQILAAGNKKHFYYVDLEKQQPYKVSNIIGSSVNMLGRCLAVSPDQSLFAVLDKSGRILVFSGITKSLLYELKMSGSADSACFTSDNRYLFTSGEECEIYQWDLGSRKLFSRIPDEGCVKNTSLSVSANSELLATGCTSGVVNIYRTQGAAHKLPAESKPVKNILNLTTAITSMKMNGTSELLAIASRWKKNALKLIHLPSMTAFSNFPSFKTNMKFVTALDFKYFFEFGKYSARSKYLCVGNDEGRTLLYRIKHYE